MKNFEEVISIMANKFDTHNTLDNFAENADLQRCDIENICEILLEELCVQGIVNIELD